MPQRPAPAPTTTGVLRRRRPRPSTGRSSARSAEPLVRVLGLVPPRRAAGSDLVQGPARRDDVAVRGRLVHRSRRVSTRGTDVGPARSARCRGRCSSSTVAGSRSPSTQGTPTLLAARDPGPRPGDDRGARAPRRSRSAASADAHRRLRARAVLRPLRVRGPAPAVRLGRRGLADGRPPRARRRRGGGAVARPAARATRSRWATRCCGARSRALYDAHRARDDVLVFTGAEEAIFASRTSRSSRATTPIVVWPPTSPCTRSRARRAPT